MDGQKNKRRPGGGGARDIALVSSSDHILILNSPATQGTEPVARNAERVMQVADLEDIEERAGIIEFDGGGQL